MGSQVARRKTLPNLAGTHAHLVETGFGDFYDGKRAAGRYFLTHELPRVGPMLDLLAGGDQLFNEVDPTTL